VVLTPRDQQRVLDRLRPELARRFGADCEEHYVAPPVIARETVERAGYPTSFPHLLGAVHAAVDGGQPAASDLVLTPAACHHVYPMLAGSGVRAARTVGVEATCFRAEATDEPGRQRSFRMYEVVFLGSASEVLSWRDRMLADAAGWLRGLGLAVEVVTATDPFFGRPGKLMTQVQRSEQLKWEITAEVSERAVQAVASANCHKEHFGEAFDITDRDGVPLHSACLAFGLDRLVLALRHRHGPDLARQLTQAGVRP
jgi:seryl-tRNA synthetase